ncbi:hypothetical protein MTR67_034806 [Solanum verrucosum]|uniref:Uncharacterized protein n=1 Tax=Solanum verrucosum TaxID=315347 RepID=A0AAF0U945_SOLVR|nr:hypothetical protein MTR67_034806 [Solanum verrucosum]
MAKINCTWYIREDQVSPLNLGLTKKHLEKNKERDENMAKIMTQMDLLMKHVIGVSYKVLNAVGANSGVSLDDAQFEAICNEDVLFLSNHVGVSRPSYPRSVGIKVGIEIMMIVGEIKIEIGAIG